MIKTYTEFQQYPCIIFEDMNILLSAIFIFRGLSLPFFLVSYVAPINQSEIIAS